MIVYLLSISHAVNSIITLQGVLHHLFQQHLLHFMTEVGGTQVFGVVIKHIPRCHFLRILSPTEPLCPLLLVLQR